MTSVLGFLHRRLEGREEVLQVASNTAWLSGYRVARMAVGLVIGIWVARYLGPTRFGMLNFAQAFVALFAAASGLGLSNIVVRELVRTPQRTPAILGTSFLLLLAAGTAAFLLAPAAAQTLPNTDSATRRLIWVFAFAPILSSFDVILYWFQAQLRSRNAVIAQTPSLALAAGARAGLILLHAPVIAFAGAYVFESAIGALGLAAAYRLARQSLGSWRYDSGLARALLREGFPLMLSGLAITLYMRSDQIMLAAMAGPESTGLYSAVVRVSELWYFLPVTLVASLHPVITAAKARSETEYRRKLQVTLSFVTSISLAVAVVMTFASDWVMALLYGPDFTGTGPILAVHIWAGIPASVGTVTTIWLLNEGLVSISLQRTLAGALTNIALNWLLIPQYGAMGAAIATVVAQVVSAYLYHAIHPATRPLFAMQMRALWPVYR